MIFGLINLKQMLKGRFDFGLHQSNTVPYLQKVKSQSQFSNEMAHHTK
jgi:hypothetical protein